MPVLVFLSFDRRRRAILLASVAILLIGCGKSVVQQTRAATFTPGDQPSSPSQQTSARRQVRATGTVQAIRSVSVQTPQIMGQGGRLTLTSLAPNGLKVNVGDVIAEFDATQQLDNAMQAKAKYDDLSHQVEQRVAQNRSDAEKRSADIQRAEADLAKAELELRKGPLLSEIDRLKNEAKLEDARAHVASLKKSSHFHDLSDTATLKILELQRDRQKVALERAQTNVQRLEVRAKIAGMVALENVWRNGSMGHAQEGDQLWNGQTLLRIFDPSQMQVRTMVGEPDGAVLVPGARALVSLDAYPDLVFTAHFQSASPVAASALGSPIKTFTATFLLEKTDPHLLPDLSAAVIIEPPDKPAAAPESNGERKQ